MKTFDIAKSDLTGCYYLVIDGEKHDITDYFKKHDAEIRRQTIEKCAEVISREMHCVICPNVCHGFVTHEECAETWKIYLAEQMKEVRNEKQQP